MRLEFLTIFAVLTLSISDLEHAGPEKMMKNLSMEELDIHLLTTNF